jgi:hypothetical protein
MTSVIDLSTVDRHSDNGSEGLIPPLAVGCADGTCLCRPHARAREEYRRGGSLDRVAVSGPLLGNV